MTPERQKADRWLSMAGAKVIGSDRFMDMGSCLGDENVLELYRGGGCTIL